jgi:cytochrome c biogenesis protein ResB
MAKQYSVKQIEFNQKMSGKYDGAYLHTISIEGGAKRKDFVFKNNEAQYKVLQELEVGNVVELKITKNGDYFNLSKDDDAIIKVEGAVAPKETLKSEGKPPWVDHKKDPDVQSAIIRQNGLTNATHLVVAMLEKGMFPAKITSDALILETTRIAGEFAKFSSGELVIEALVKEKSKGKPEEPISGGGEFGE